MNLLALDQASRVSGWAVFKDGHLEQFGKIELKDEDIGARLVVLRQEVKRIIDIYEINEVAFEDIQLQSSVGSNVLTFKVLASVYGNILEMLTEMGINYTIVPSVKWKSTLGIKGKKRVEQKTNAQNYVIETFGVKPTQDECDAICIGVHALLREFPEGRSWAKE